MTLDEVRALSAEDRATRRTDIDEAIHSVTRTLANDKRLDPVTAKRMARLTAERRKLKMAEESSKDPNDAVDDDSLRYAF